MSITFLPSALLFMLFSLLIRQIYTLVKRREYLPLPPGPQGHLFIGNLKDLPPSGTLEWEHWAKHRQLYGPISSLTIFGQTIVIINDNLVAHELLEKRSSTYSARPRMVFAFEMCGWGKLMPGLSDGSLFRLFRKKASSLLRATHLLDTYGHIQESEVAHLLQRLLQDPDYFLEHIRTEIGAIILKITYGYSIEPSGSDPLVTLADNALDQFSQAAVSGKWLVDILPALQFVPEWLPGAGFKRIARKWSATTERMVELPYQFVKDQIATGKPVSSFLEGLVNSGIISHEDEIAAKWTAGALYAGGSDTTVAALSSFCLAMISHPEAQAKAQDEIDQVIGTERLPTFKDRVHLPYVNAIVMEVLRWQPVAPMCLAHAASRDDHYGGYLIPKGAIILPNVGLFTHDPKTYKDPMTFNPDRFIDTRAWPAEKDPSVYAFGFGRRICPGRVLADQTLFLTIVQVLATFKLSRDLEMPELGTNSQPGIISHPVPFKARITVRDTGREVLVRRNQVKYPLNSGDRHKLPR